MSVSFNVVSYAPIRGDISPKAMIKAAELSIKKVLNVQWVGYGEFKANTLSRPIRNYIMIPSDRVRQQSELISNANTATGVKDIIAKIGTQRIIAKDTDLSNAIKKKLDTGISIRKDHFTYANPRYGFADIHDIHNIPRLCLRINLNPKIPVQKYTIHDRIALAISKLGYRSESMSIEKVSGIDCEHLTVFKGGEVIASNTVPLGKKHLFTTFRDKTGIDIVDILMNMDRNIEVSLAPHDLKDLQRALKAYKASKTYMEKQKMQNSEDYKWLLGDIRIMKENIEVLHKTILEEPHVKSFYFRLMDPRVLSHYKLKVVKEDS